MFATPENAALLVNMDESEESKTALKDLVTQRLDESLKEIRANARSEYMVNDFVGGKDGSNSGS